VVDALSSFAVATGGNRYVAGVSASTISPNADERSHTGDSADTLYAARPAAIQTAMKHHVRFIV
jgi:hypothetical protein